MKNFTFALVLTAELLSLAAPIYAAKPTSAKRPEIVVAEFGTGKVAHVVIPDKGRVTTNLIDVNGRPFDVKSPDGKSIYVSVWSSGAPGSVDGIRVIKNDTVVATMPSTGTPRYMTVNDKDKLLVASTSNSVDIYDIEKDASAPNGRKNTLVSSIPLSGAFNVDFNDKHRLAVVGSDVRLYNLKDPALPALIAQKSFGILAVAAMFSAFDDTKLYVGFAGTASAYDASGNLLTGNLFVVDSKSLEPKAALQLGSSDLDSFSTAFSRLYVTGRDGALYTIDATTNLLMATMTLGSVLAGEDSSATKLFIADQQLGKIFTVVLGGSATSDQVGLAIDLGATSQPIGLEVLQ
jgi:hypothetical protein